MNSSDKSSVHSLCSVCRATYDKTELQFRYLPGGKQQVVIPNVCPVCIRKFDLVFREMQEGVEEGHDLESFMSFLQALTKPKIE